ncbi:redoxin domain-containing protein [Arcobacter sp. CECT 8985]|uniref:redoxin domain-containing protein n=1 Tax=Arcobacter sp. CECT 8985 TaxID=1935424 RepID=UPI00100BEFC2|nr:redoxin domain-containing protein [Arcobacter sp. CECT 8985]RXJ87058.1 protein disulfide oxidoreductase [Arcobacter sp. CECT 8985]
MNQKIKKFLKEIIKFAIVAFIAINAFSYYNSLDLNKQNLHINQFKLLDDSKYSIKGDKPLVIHFWATWCPICKLEAPNIQKLSKDYNVITIATQSKNKKHIQEYLNEHNLNFNVVEDKSGKYAKEFNIKAFPTTLIYDKNKVLKFSEVGYTSTFGLYLRMWYIKLFS